MAVSNLESRLRTEVLAALQSDALISTNDLRTVCHLIPPSRPLLPTNIPRQRIVDLLVDILWPGILANWSTWDDPHDIDVHKAAPHGILAAIIPRDALRILYGKIDGVYNEVFTYPWKPPQWKGRAYYFGELSRRQDEITNSEAAWDREAGSDSGLDSEMSVEWDDFMEEIPQDSSCFAGSNDDELPEDAVARLSWSDHQLTKSRVAIIRQGRPEVISLLRQLGVDIPNDDEEGARAGVSVDILNEYNHLLDEECVPEYDKGGTDGLRPLWDPYSSAYSVFRQHAEPIVQALVKAILSTPGVTGHGLRHVATHDALSIKTFFDWDDTKAQLAQLLASALYRQDKYEWITAHYPAQQLREFVQCGGTLWHLFASPSLEQLLATEHDRR